MTLSFDIHADNEQRSKALQLVQVLITALEERGFKWEWTKREELAVICFGGVRCELIFRNRSVRWQPFRLTIVGKGESWETPVRKDYVLEDRLGEILVQIIKCVETHGTIVEAQRRKELELAELRRIEEERRAEEEKRIREERQRRERIEAQAVDWERAQRLRHYALALNDTAESTNDERCAAIRAWAEWALACADSIDPLKREIVEQHEPTRNQTPCPTARTPSPTYEQYHSHAQEVRNAFWQGRNSVKR